MSNRLTGLAQQYSMNVKLNRVLLIAFLLFLVSGIALAQVLYGTLTGTVTDSSGALVSAAHVTAVEVQTGVSQTATSDSAGIYRFPSILPGTYKITIEASGFSTQQTSGVGVRVNEVARLDAQLKVASTTQSVVVTTEVPLLQTDRADVHTDFTAQQIQNLPTMGSQGRNFQSLLRSMPGTGMTAETNSQAGNPQRAINTNVNGQSNQGVNTRLDGAQDAYPWLPANVAYVPPSDGIEAVNVTTNSFDAEQGMAGGAAVNVQIKSGTNQFHGDVHEFHTDQHFQTRNYFQTDLAHFPVNLNPNIRNQYGGSIGGPILRSRLFFFGDFERTTNTLRAGPDSRLLPTQAMASGNFNGLTDSKGNPIIIYDPATGDAHGAGKQQVSCNGVLNVICPNRIDPAAAAFVQLLQPSIAQVVSTAQFGSNNWQGSKTAFFTDNNADVKINYVPGQKSTVFGRYSFSQTYVFDPPLLGPAIGDATNGGQLGNAPGLVQSAGLGATYAFTPNVLLDWNFGFTRQRLGSTFDLTSARGLNDLKIPGTNNAETTGDPSLYYGYPGFIFPTAQIPASNAVTTLAALGNAQPANPFLFRDQQYVSGANLTWIKGRHSLRGGIEWNHTQLNHFQPQGGTFQQPRGSFEFNGYVTSLQGSTPNYVNSWADFLFGLPSGTGKARALENPNALRWSQWAWYVRDQWQVTPQLTLNLGVRWEYYPFGYSDNHTGLRVLNLSTGNVLIGGLNGVPLNSGVDVGHGQFLPRVGVAYRLRPTTVIRGGYGMSADPYTWHVLRNAYPAVLLDTNIEVTGNTSDYVPAASLTGLNATGLGTGSYSVPVGVTLTPLPNLNTTLPLPKSISTTTVPLKFQRGYINSYNATVEQQLAKNLAFQIGYVGTYNIRPVVNMNANASAPGTGSAGGLLSQAYGGNYTGTINELNPFQHARYDSLQTQATYRMTGGSSVGAAYTWSKAINYADNEDLGSLSFPYPAFWQKNRALASYDRTQNIELWGVVALPFGKGQRWLQSGPGNWILGGWLINPIISKMSGVPFTVGAGGGGTTGLNANGSAQTADLVGTFHKLNGKPPRTFSTCLQDDPSCHFFSASDFAAPLICTSTNTVTCPTFYPAHYGNTGRNQFRGPGYFNMNLSILRNFKFTERVSMDVRADAMGLTNTPHFANPNVGCPSNGGAPGPFASSGALCDTGANNNFGVITSTASPGGFFGPDPGIRIIWLGATVKF